MWTKRPKIGITGPDKGGGTAWMFTAMAVLVAGGYPVRIRPGKPRDVEGLQGLIIGGGADVDPVTYEQREVLKTYFSETLENERRSFISRITSFISWLIFPLIFLIRKWLSGKRWIIDKRRDHLEFRLLRQAEAKNIPVLGICRGAQLMNVYFGGSLHKEINDFYVEYPNRSSIFPVKQVRVSMTSRLASIIRKPVIRVNALHHQAVRTIGDSLSAVAKEANAIIQAIESRRHRFMIGVQWHPEYIFLRSDQLRLFKALINAGRETG